jgi:hypothetical protein
MNDQTTLLLIKGVISDLSSADQKTVKQCAGQLKVTIKEAGVYGSLALALVGAEAAVEAPST